MLGAPAAPCCWFRGRGTPAGSGEGPHLGRVWRKCGRSGVEQSVNDECEHEHEQETPHPFELHIQLPAAAVKTVILLSVLPMPDPVPLPHSVP